MISIKKITSVVATSALLVLSTATAASAGSLTAVSVTPDNPVADANGVTWAIAFTGASASTNCVKVEVNSTTDFGTPSLPAGAALTTLTASGGTWAGNSSSTSSNKIAVFGSTAGAATAASLTLDNPTAAGNAYVKVTTFTGASGSASGDCTGGAEEHSGSSAAVITEETTVTLTVDSAFTFAVSGASGACGTLNRAAGSSGTTVPLGAINAASTAVGGQNYAVTSNAAGGWNVNIKASTAPAMRDGVKTIANAVDGTTLVAGTEMFGYHAGDVHASNSNLDAITTGWESVGSGTANELTNCVAFGAAASGTTASGSYTAQITYQAVPTY